MRSSSKAARAFTTSNIVSPNAKRRCQRMSEPTSYRELVIEIGREHAEALSDALIDLGALSVSVEDADADTPDEQPLFGEPGLTPEREAWTHSRVIALVAPDAEPDVLLAAAANELGLDHTPSHTMREV